MEPAGSNCQRTGRSAASVLGRWLDRLDSLSPLRFTLTLYLLRWVALAPAMALVSLCGPGPANQKMAAQLGQSGAVELCVGLLLLAPTIETAIECTLPYVLLRWLLRRRPNVSWQRPWPFIATAALAMVLLHPLQWQVILPTAVTGSFLGYTYGHFAVRGHMAAFAATALFHAGINLVGFTLLTLVRQF